MPSPTHLDATEAHELALLLSGRCRRCAERLPGGTTLRGRPCPRCSEPTLPSALDREVLQALQASQSATRLWLAVALVSAGALVASWFPLANSLLLAAVLLWLRFTLVKPSLLLLTPQRRFVSRWTLRLAAGCFLSLSMLLLELLTLLPVAGALLKTVLSALQVALAGAFTLRYLERQTGREARGEPVAGWELALLAVWMGGLLAAVAATVAGVLWVLNRLGLLQSWLPGPA